MKLVFLIALLGLSFVSCAKGHSVNQPFNPRVPTDYDAQEYNHYYETQQQKKSDKKFIEKYEHHKQDKSS